MISKRLVPLHRESSRLFFCKKKKKNIPDVYQDPHYKYTCAKDKRVRDVNSPERNKKKEQQKKNCKNKGPRTARSKQARNGV